MPTQSECRATFSPRFPLDSHRGKHRIGADGADYILETFPIVKLHDEEEFGEYGTKRVILERYGEHREGMRRNRQDHGTPMQELKALVGGGGFPELPTPLTVASLAGYLSRLGVKIDTSRTKGFGLYVYRSDFDFAKLAEHVRRSGIEVKHYPEGRMRNPGEQWEIDPDKRLGW